MIHIKPPYLTHENQLTRCYCDIFVEDEKRTIWFEVDKKYEQYLCTERSDAYVIGLLNWCLRENHDIKCDVPITEELLFNITNLLIPALVKYSSGNIHNIKIIAPTAPTLQCGTAVGTGCSCGIDSFTAIYNHFHTDFPEHDITHLCINNVGAFNECYSEYGEENVKRERYQKTRELMLEFNNELEYIESDSNFLTEFYQNHLLTHTYSSVFAIYMLQKLWKYYYYASAGEGYEAFSLIEHDKKSAANYELLSLQCFSTSGLRIYSESAELNRLDKTKKIVDIPVVGKHLHVCVCKPYNCGVCSKCRRTLLTLDLLNKLDLFAGSFDIEYYKTHRNEYLEWLYKMHLQQDEMNEPVYQEFLKHEDFKELVKQLTRRNKKIFLLRILKKIIPHKIKLIWRKMQFNGK